MSTFKSKLSVRVAALRYNLFRKPRILRRVKARESINVVFFAMNVAMWKYDSFFRLLMQDSRFRPMVVSFLLPDDPPAYQRRVQEEMKAFFRERGYPFFESMDVETGRFLDIKSLHPDIVFYAQPYDVGYAPFVIRALWNTCLFAYIPYCYHMEDDAGFYNRLLHQVAWRLFYPTEHHRRIASRYSLVGGRNIVVSAYPMADALLQPGPAACSLWKEGDPSVKRVIWAPHHSVFRDKGLGYSRFLELAEGMTELARKYRGRIQFVLKPHPRLRPVLASLPSWGEEKTDAFFRLWETMPNTAYTEGDYVDLFRSSDAMIHDCSSFLGEYLYFDKPVLFTGVAATAETHLNSFGKACLDCHYKGGTLEDVEVFLNQVVLGGEDPLEPARDAFRQELLQEGGAGRRLYRDFTAALGCGCTAELSGK